MMSSLPIRLLPDFDDVFPADPAASPHIRRGPCHAQELVNDPCAVAVLFALLFQNPGALFIQCSVFLDMGYRHLCVAVHALLAFEALFLDSTFRTHFWISTRSMIGPETLAR